MSDTLQLTDLQLAEAMADAARRAVMPYFRTGLAVENKLAEGFDPVTEADRASEAAMRELLDIHRPDDSVLGEEYGLKAGRNGRQWILDPVDGTRAFISGLPSWTVLIGLAEDERAVLGVIDQPHIEERFCGSRAGSEYVRAGERRQMGVRQTAKLSDAVMATTDAYLFEGEERRVFETVRDRARLCRYGFDAYAYAMLALGGIDLVIESGLQPYDVQALIPVVEGAGGLITSWTGGRAEGGGQVVAACSAELHAEAMACLAPAAV